MTLLDPYFSEYFRSVVVICVEAEVGIRRRCSDAMGSQINSRKRSTRTVNTNHVDRMQEGI